MAKPNLTQAQETAAEKAAREAAEKEAAEKAAREAAERDAAEKAAREAAERDAAEKATARKAAITPGSKLSAEQRKAVQKINAEFTRNVSFASQSSGSFVLAEEQRADARDVGVPDGRYRVIGCDWIIRFADGRFVEAEKGGPKTDPHTYRHVPVED